MDGKGGDPQMGSTLDSRLQGRFSETSNEQDKKWKELKNEQITKMQEARLRAGK